MMHTWTFLTNHTHVLICIAGDPEMRVRDIATKVGLTERAAHRIIGELRDAGVLDVEKAGRRNLYRINGRKKLRHPIEAKHSVGELIDLLGA